MKNEKIGFSLKSIEFVFRHPWIFLYVFCIILTAAFTRLSSIPLFYRTSAIISVETTGQSIISSRFVQQKHDLLSRILIGKNMNRIITEVWPELDEDLNPMTYNQFVEKLRKPTGISMKYGGERLLNIVYKDKDPQICYKVVRAVIKRIIEENEESSKSEIETGIIFLSSQVEFYKKKIKSITNELVEIKRELDKNYSKLTPLEKTLISEMAAELIPQGETSVDLNLQKSIKYDEMMTKLNLQLLETQRRKRALQKRQKVVKNLPAESVNPGEDHFVKECSNNIASKELQIANLLSEGYMPEHPQIKALESQVINLEKVREKRYKELLIRAPQLSHDLKKREQKEMEREIEEQGIEIESLKDRIALLAEYKRESEKKLGVADSTSGEYSEMVRQFVDLKKERGINEGYYNELRRQLEEAEIKKRLYAQEQTGMRINVVEEPRVPVEPIPFQRFPKILLGFITAMAVGISGTYLVDTMDDSVKNNNEVRELLEIPILASIDKFYTPREVLLRRLRVNSTILGLLALMVMSFLSIKILGL